jgi:hypothetical protein
MMSGVCNVIDRSIECALVCFRRFSETAQLSDELQRRRANFVVGRRRTEVMKCFDRSAHRKSINRGRRGEQSRIHYADENGFSFFQQSTLNYELPSDHGLHGWKRILLVQ